MIVSLYDHKTKTQAWSNYINIFLSSGYPIKERLRFDGAPYPVAGVKNFKENIYSRTYAF